MCKLLLIGGTADIVSFLHFLVMPPLFYVMVHSCLWIIYFNLKIKQNVNMHYNVIIVSSWIMKGYMYLDGLNVSL
jgi:hypothetical protein